MVIKFKKLHNDAKLPQHHHSGDAGIDLTVVSIEADNYGNHVHKFGLAVEIPEGNVGLVFMRSSIFKKDIMLSNAVGVIDSNYRGELMAKFLPADKFLNGEPEEPYKEGEKSVQLLIVPVRTLQTEWAEELSDTTRGAGGYGSTGV